MRVSRQINAPGPLAQKMSLVNKKTQRCTHRVASRCFTKQCSITRNPLRTTCASRTLLLVTKDGRPLLCKRFGCYQVDQEVDFPMMGHYFHEKTRQCSHCDIWDGMLLGAECFNEISQVLVLVQIPLTPCFHCSQLCLPQPPKNLWLREGGGGTKGRDQVPTAPTHNLNTEMIYSSMAWHPYFAVTSLAQRCMTQRMDFRHTRQYNG